jgi:excisionase family DNA binding protein
VPEQLLTVQQVAARLQVSRTTVYKLIRAGHLVAIHPAARKTRVRPSDLERFIDRHDTNRRRS